MKKDYEEFDIMINGRELYGTVVMNENYQIFWSKEKWNSPIDGLRMQPERWTCLGQSTWWSNEEQKVRYKIMDNILGYYLPSSPCENFEFGRRYKFEDKDD